MRFLCLVMALAACSGGKKAQPSAPTGGGTAAYDCNQHSFQAAAKLDQAVRGKTSCQTDADCETVAMGTACSDHCTMVASHDGAAAVKTASEAASASECAGFQAAGCKIDHPPCAPPRPPTCVQGTCQ
jgi:hypothetical protein